MDLELNLRLTRLRGKLRRLLAANGMMWIAVVILSAVLTGIALDWWLRLPAAVRAALLLGSLVLTLYTAWKFLLKPLLIPLRLDDMALAVERRYPKLGDRLITAVQLSRVTAEQPSAAISPAMVGALTEEAAEMSRDLNFHAVLEPHGLHTRTGLGIVLIMAFLLLSFFPEFLSVGMVRYVNPFTEAQWRYRTRLQVAGGRTRKVPKGDDVAVRVRASGQVPSRAVIYFRYGGSGGWDG